MPEHYDVVVVGGGSAGCAAAARLSEDPGRSVLLLEAGPDPRPLPDIVSSPLGFRDLWDESPYVINYPTTREIDGSIFPSRSGRIMGGGSSVNVMAAPRPTRHDLDTWASLGNPTGPTICSCRSSSASNPTRTSPTARSTVRTVRSPSDGRSGSDSQPRP